LRELAFDVPLIPLEPQGIRDFGHKKNLAISRGLFYALSVEVKNKTIPERRQGHFFMLVKLKLTVFVYLLTLQ